MKICLLMPCLLLAIPGHSTDLGTARPFHPGEARGPGSPEGLPKPLGLPFQPFTAKGALACPAPETDPLRETADAAMKALKLPEDSWRYQNRADAIDEYEDGTRVFVERTFLYRRMLEGTPVFGPGTSVQVTVSKDGRLKSVQADWAPALETSWRVEDFAHLDPERMLKEAFPPEQVPPGVTLRVLGLRYCTRLSGKGMAVEPVMMVRAVPEVAGCEGVGEHLFLRILP